MYYYKPFLLTLVCLVGLSACVGTSSNNHLAHKPPVSGDIAPPKRVALLLPLQGPHAKSARAIRDGLLAAYYQNLDTPDAMHIKIHDTGRGDDSTQLRKAYEAALNEQAECIIGPLTKFEVEAVSHYAKHLPQLVLNTLPANATANLVQYSLLPEAEARLGAERAHQSGLGHAIVIAPSSDWGRRMAQAFVQEFTHLGGETLEVQYVASHDPLNQLIKNVLQIKDLPPQDKSSPKVPKEKPLDYEPRVDIDMVYLAAPADLARQIKPLLNYYNAGKLAVLASSYVYTGQNMPELDKDLDGIIFCDMPWLIDNRPPTLEARQQVIQQWGESFEHAPRLFAMGMDVYQLLSQSYPFQRLETTPLVGYTGLLRMNDTHHIEHTLEWSQFRDGSPQLLGSGIALPRSSFANSQGF